MSCPGPSYRDAARILAGASTLLFAAGVASGMLLPTPVQPLVALGLYGGLRWLWRGR